jgi:hypothetical protein
MDATVFETVVGENCYLTQAVSMILQGTVGILADAKRGDHFLQASFPVLIG